MITVPGFIPGAPTVWEIGPDGFKKPEKAEFPNTIDPTKKPVTRYVAQSSSVLLVEKIATIEITVGRFVTEDVLKNVMGYAMKQGKTLEITKCENLDNLREVDRMVVLCNEFVKFAEPKLEDITIDDLDEYPGGMDRYGSLST